MSRRTWTLLTSVVLVVAFGLLGGFVRVPYVALGPGPTYNTLGSPSGEPVIQVDGHRTFPTSGHLNMTTVSVTDHLSLLSALGLWVSGSYALAPREVYFPPNKTEKQIERKNTRAFKNSQTTAEAAALSYLGYPVRVVADEVVPGSPAEGVIAPGDEILSADGQRITDPQSLTEALSDTKPGDRVRVRFKHGDAPARVATVRLAQRPDDQPQGFLGVNPAPRPAADFSVDISLADVGGPSAGLMFALAIVDKLTPGKLTGGAFVAGTGEITGQGKVGPIGGIGFKMVKAHEAGATVFLTPARNCPAAKSQAPDGMQLVKVNTLADAVDALNAIRTGEKPPTC